MHAASETGAASTGPATMDAMTAWDSPLFVAFNVASGACVRAWSDWQHEMGRVIAAGIESELKAQRSLAGCTSVVDLLTIQQTLASELAQSCSEGMTRLVQIPGRALGTAIDAGTGPATGSAPPPR